jgi:hypothetical protein
MSASFHPLRKPSGPANIRILVHAGMTRTRLLAGAFIGHKNTTVSRNKLFSKGPIAVEKAHGKNAAFEKTQFT